MVSQQTLGAAIRAHARRSSRPLGSVGRCQSSSRKSNRRCGKERHLSRLPYGLRESEALRSRSSLSCNIAHDDLMTSSPQHRARLTSRSQTGIRNSFATACLQPGVRNNSRRCHAARRSSPWRGASAAQPRRLLAPVRPGVGTDHAAAGADHARAERWHWHVVRPAVGTQHRLMMALPTRHRERPHAVGAHVAEGHRRSDLRSWARAHVGEDAASAASSESCRASVVANRAALSRRTIGPTGGVAPASMGA
jgi:hypothetical protein